jgi:iron complex transport system substrate-binding protein
MLAMRRSMLCTSIAAALLGLVAACGNSDESLTERAGAAAANPDPLPGLRIVSLSPAISRTLVDLGLEDHIVGRTPFCDSLESAVPVVGDLIDLDLERLVRVRPSHVLVQPPAGGIDPALLRLAPERGWRLAAWQLDDIGDVKRLVRELPAALFETAEERADIEARANGLIAAIDRSLDSDASEHVAGFTGRVLLAFGTDPVSAFGEGTYLHDVLIALGAANAVSARGYPQFTLEDVRRLDPDAIVLVRPGRSGGTVLAALGPLGRLDIHAVRERRLAVLTHPDAFMPSSAVIGVVEELRSILRAMEPRMHMDEHGWIPEVDSDFAVHGRMRLMTELALSPSGLSVSVVHHLEPR